MKTESKFKVSVRVKDHSPMIGVEVPFAIETNFWLEGLSGETYLESNIMWSVASESIIYALYEIGVEIFKVLPPLFEEITNAEACLVTASLIFAATTIAVEDFFWFFFERLWSHQSGYPTSSKHLFFVWLVL